MHNRKLLEGVGVVDGGSEFPECMKRVRVRVKIKFVRECL